MLRHRNQAPLQGEDEAPKTTPSPIIARYVSKEYAPLPLLEVFIYAAFIITVFSRAFFAVYEASKEYKDVLYSFNFEEGWYIFWHKDKDIGDFEWTHWRNIFFSPGVLVVMVLHAALGRIVGYVYPKYRTSFLLCFAVVSIYLFVGLRLLLYFLCHSLLMYTVTCTASMSTVWCIVLMQIASINLDFFLRFQRYIFTDEDDLNMMVFTLAMCTLRHISFAYEFCHFHSTPVARRPNEKQYWGILDFLLYIYYLPLFFGGPVLTYDKFSRQINLSIHMLNSVEWKHILKELFRYIFWAMFIETVLHFLYFPAFHQRPFLLNSMSLWAVGGLALCQLLFFQMKYTVMYGLPRVHAMFDHINAPLPPVCILGMYLFQDFWRYFDRGLHSLLVRCIYIPLGGSKRGFVWQIMASICCFSFVCFWHGADKHLVYWAIFNCVGLQMEVLVGKIAHWTCLNNLLLRYLSGAMYRRLIALLLTPNYMCLALSNLIFLCGNDISYSYYNNLIWNGWPNTCLATFFTFYCTIQLIMSINSKYGKDFMCNKFYYRTW
ncbi:protein-cysteine N-palmitoyltransferase HHAT [Strongylocentrotus purpuratus]|uniref:Protein-cysteine N-palmitoyltransferase Rasp n=1 Tax=Strongylocentrotus purpuratus TaxID=7668 RepID=A0A7M7T533_STRPU|nr:protein-cysteine N-palmitoyltransferase HHAT [Strongylocentrotus purpuratus]XP_030854461.1 protein-cysteine N-palmitoyltransferase HHAT [Strongylocentrotus purpuratus]